MEQVKQMAIKSFMILISCLLAFTLIPCAFPSVAQAAADPITEGSKGSITVTNANNNDTLAAYKIVDVTYNSTTNEVKTSFNPSFAGYFDNNGISIDAYKAYSEEQLREALKSLPEWISENSGSISAVSNATVTDGRVVFSDLEMGGYFIQPTSTTQVYQLMVANLAPKVKNTNSTYYLEDVALAAKYNSVGISKEASVNSVSKTSIDGVMSQLTYTITIDKPIYNSEVLEGNRIVQVIDTPSAGIEINKDSITVEGFTASDTWTELPETNYVLSNAGSDNKGISLNFGGALYNDNDAYTQFRITYKATANDNIVIGIGDASNLNTAEFTYSTYPYVGSTNRVNATANVKSYGIIIDKHKDGEESTKLKNAKFKLYRTAVNGESNTTTVKDANKNDVVVVELNTIVTTDENGSATIDGLKETDGFKYYLVETQAPTGYALPPNAIEITINPAGNGNVDDNGHVTVKIPNGTNNFSLPITGEAGTILFTVIGIALMAGAVALFLRSKKRVSGKQTH